MPRVIHFEIQADDLNRAAKFYTDAFDWEFKKWEGPMEYWLIMTGSKDQPGIDGGLMKRMDKKGDSMAAYICTIDVPNIDEYIKRVESAGGKIVKPKDEIPGVGWFAYCQDTEGNIFGLMQMTVKM